MNKDIINSRDELQGCFEYILNDIDEEALSDTTILSQEETNLPCVVWALGCRNIKYGKIIKFQDSSSSIDDGSQLIPMTISNSPEIPNHLKNKLKLTENDIEKIKRWTILNEPILLKYSKGKLSSKKLLERITPI